MGEDGPLFSVIVPTRGRPALLARAVASVLGQTVADLELLVVDDASPEPPVLVDDPRVRLIRRPVNGGPAAAFNTGADAARGRYLAFLADDDLWTPDRLELALAGLARAPIALCWARYLDEVPEPKRVLDGDVADVILDHVTPSLGATAVDRTAWLPYDERYDASEDVELWLRLAARHHVATVPRVGLLVRRHAEVRGRHGDRARIEGSIRLLDDHRAWFDAHPKAAALRWQRIGLTAQRAGDPTTARRAFLRSFCLRPRAAPLVHLGRTFRPARARPPGSTGGVR